MPVLFTAVKAKEMVAVRIASMKRAAHMWRRGASVQRARCEEVPVANDIVMREVHVSRVHDVFHQCGPACRVRHNLLGGALQVELKPRSNRDAQYPLDSPPCLMMHQPWAAVHHEGLWGDRDSALKGSLQRLTCSSRGSLLKEGRQAAT